MCIIIISTRLVDLIILYSKSIGQIMVKSLTDDNFFFMESDFEVFFQLNFIHLPLDE